MAISREKGIEHIEVHKKSINKMKFKMFLERLRQLNLFEDVMLVMDNIAFHKSGDTQDRMDELGFKYSYTPVYSPWYNGIEEVIGMIKQKVKRKRLESMVSGDVVDLR